MRSLDILLLATAILAAPSCSPTIDDAREEVSKRLKVCTTGGPITQCCDVSILDSKGLSKTRQKINIADPNQVKSLFTCQKGSRMVSDSNNRTACLDGSFKSLSEKKRTCNAGQNLEPIINCDPEKRLKTISWQCYSGPYQR